MVLAIEGDKVRNILRCALALTFSALGLSAQEANVIAFPHQGPAFAPDSSYQGIAAASVTISTGGPNEVLPCFSCVPGTMGGVTFGDPRYLLDFDASESMAVALLIEDGDYTGPCTGIYELLRNNIPILSGYQEIYGGCAPDTDYIVYWDYPVSLRKGEGPVLLKGAVAINAGPVASAVEQTLQSSFFPAPSGIIGPTTITIGVPETGLPCYNCAPSWLNALTLSVPTPMFVVPRGQNLMVTMEVQDSTYTGACTFVYQIRQGTNVVADGSHSATCSAHSVRIPTFSVTIPLNTPSGPANLSGGVIAGGQTYAMYQPILIH